MLRTDSSGFGIRDVLSQMSEEGEEYVTAFVSRSVKGAELNYTTTGKELLVIIYSQQKI